MEVGHGGGGRGTLQLKLTGETSRNHALCFFAKGLAWCLGLCPRKAWKEWLTNNRNFPSQSSRGWKSEIGHPQKRCQERAGFLIHRRPASQWALS